jgi:NADP-dependent 3-hydroxy acid dehydrogenase YdfG
MAQEFATSHSIKTQAYKVDVSNADSVQKSITEVVKDFGKIDVFVANAGELLDAKRDISVF